ncbi:MAG: hypothetical protein OEV40_29155, partial [Acidimicrobiia bacterium]|nr:hypothetical protein [Acidimicrobiia bacterium]
LSMPSGFWTDGPRPAWLTKLADRQEKRSNERWNAAYDKLRDECQHDDVLELGDQVEDGHPFSDQRMEGPAFTYMVRTHRILVVPGLGAGVLGIAAAVAGESTRLIIALGVATAVTAAWYLRGRPALGVD